MLLVLVVEVVTPVVYICQNSLEWYSSNGCVFAACKVYLTEVYFKIKYIGILLPDQEIKSRSKTIPGKPFYCSPSAPTIFSFGKNLVFIICTNGGEQWPREFKKRITHESFASDGSGMCFVAYLVCE